MQLYRMLAERSGSMRHMSGNGTPHAPDPMSGRSERLETVDASGCEVKRNLYVFKSKV